MAAFELFNLTFYTTYVVIEAFINQKDLRTCFFRLDIYAIFQFIFYFSSIIFILTIASSLRNHEDLAIWGIRIIGITFALLNIYGFFAYWISLFKTPSCLTRGLKFDLGITVTVYFLLVVIFSTGILVAYLK